MREKIIRFRVSSNVTLLVDTLIREQYYQEARNVLEIIIYKNIILRGLKEILRGLKETFNLQINIMINRKLATTK